MKNINLIFGGLKCSKKVLKKYASIYDNESFIIPFTFTALLIGEKNPDFNQLNDKLKNYQNIHIHSLSASPLLVYYFLNRYPDNKEKIQSQIYDSPCHVSGSKDFFWEKYNIPYCWSNYIFNNYLKEYSEISEKFSEKPIHINSNIGLICSDKDTISPKKPIDKLLNKWGQYQNIEVLRTNSNHIETFKDEPNKYKYFCNKIKNNL